MGPVRGKLTRAFTAAAALFWPLQAMAEVCDKEAEGWNGFRRTATDELTCFLSSPWSILLIGATLAALLSGNRLLCRLCAAGFLWPLFAQLLLWDRAILTTAQAEGCVGPFWLLNGTLLAPLPLLRWRARA